MIIKQSTAKKLPCLLYDKTDFITPETGVAYTAPTVKYRKEGGAWTTKTLASGDWTEIGNGVYDISFTAAELDTLGTFVYQVADAQVTYVDFNGLALVESGTNSDIETKIDTIDTNLDAVKDTDLPAVKTDTAAILTDTGTTLPATLTTIESKVDTVDTVVDAIKARTDAIATATEDNTAHGSGSWETGDGTGAYVAVINVKDGSANAVTDAKVTIHNASNDDSPLIASGITNNSGNTTLNIDGNLYVRVKKAGFTFSSTAINVTASATYNVTGTVNTITPPADSDLCRMVIYPVTLGDADVTDLKVYINSYSDFTKIDGKYIKNNRLEFTYDATTDPDSYYFDALQGASVQIECRDLGISRSITVPDESTKDLSDLIS